ncbi:hypothetical protein [Ammoniphilus sp. YIM 78166]|uniref:hypothetical protein n=1 Tax=Ammoniphilus sp. YIM 78166 TaxID=1644106 RepID=UPI0014314BAC|nr:hypothetical protein [Ammoniphilus sp. YIM 78166]
MKKLITLLLLCIPLILLVGFKNQKDLTITHIETTLIKSEKILRYDFRIKNISNKPITSKFDYPGHHPFGLQVVVRPNEKLESLMKMETNTKYKKMQHRGYGGSGGFDPQKEAAFHLEYEIKDQADLDEVKKHALDATLVVLDGINVLAEISLDN